MISIVLVNYFPLLVLGMLKEVRGRSVLYAPKWVLNARMGKLKSIWIFRRKISL